MTEFPHIAAIALAAALVAAVFVGRMRRTHTARRRFERMLAAAHHPSRRLIEVLRLLRTSRTGQLLLVIDARSGQEAALWLPPQSLRQGDVALLVWMECQWVLMERRSARQIRRAGRDRRHRLGEASIDWPVVRASGVAQEAERFLRR